MMQWCTKIWNLITYVVNKVIAGIFNLFPQKHLWRNWWSQSRDIGQIILPISARPPGNHISHLDRYLLLFLAAGGVPVIFQGNLVYLKLNLYIDGIHNGISIHYLLQSLYYYPISRFQLHFLFPQGSAVLRWSEYTGALKLIVPQVFVLIYVFTTNAIGLDLSVQYAIYIASEYKSYTKLRCTFEFEEWVAHCSKKLTSTLILQEVHCDQETIICMH